MSSQALSLTTGPRSLSQRLSLWLMLALAVWVCAFSTGAGAQILSDLGLGKLRVLGTPRRQIGLAGYGLEVVETVTL